MTENEEKALIELVEQLRSLNSKLDKLIKNMDKQLGVEEEESLSNKLLKKATSKDTSDKQYCQTLVELNKLPFSLSAKQLAWVVFNALLHKECGQEIRCFIQKQIEKHQNKTDYITQIEKVLRGKYQNDNNYQYVEKLIARIKEI